MKKPTHKKSKRTKLKARGQSKSTSTDFTQYLTIDPHDLEQELIRQPSLYYEAGRRVADAQLALDQAEANLSKVKHGLEVHVRAELEENREKGERVTNALVETHVKRERDYLRARQEWIEAGRAVEDARALRDAFYQRSHSLRDLANLRVANIHVENASNYKS